MTCKQLVGLLAELQAGELPATVCDQLESHLADCPDCRRYLRSYQSTVRLAALASKHRDDEKGGR